MALGARGTWTTELSSDKRNKKKKKEELEEENHCRSNCLCLGPPLAWSDRQSPSHLRSGNVNVSHGSTNELLRQADCPVIPVQDK